ncbi:hypothetical protein [Cupriavidus taiwanensis]|uniref:hypothetical protein n=1 Tax=Cupriavidus taiwanensis TaxID=164546 RepID=UPI000E10A5B6|nr:hypothetical protein [Cupriavidus taiwanensis]SOY56875.1 conserved hypothetical protein [Cupriavidus taiwanensis]SOY90820.1 conserved hypothetical protein [Cupriavidus taiwanensis]SOZ63610.1 conserved hypothetical protein [Cupriavidus taiwanensis]SOZ82626.1 conserved hypothetical protein [Cupriavidus taiwanensis]SOZ84462.1 conserved hypothetical protein [Cupriavidus taiwanensis]
MTIHVQFSDEQQAVIVSCFNTSQDPEYWPNQGVVTSDDPRWHAYYESLPETFRQYLPAPTAE